MNRRASRLLEIAHLNLSLSRVGRSIGAMPAASIGTGPGIERGCRGNEVLDATHRVGA
ncbi:hypothetical protein Salmuc_05685 [Salipiger mucosus DSM 16094]|uniref:Uncharacterized protein n=1 Tax=Salipiger mucosus DSM 16094 TaxID=1123237 RepID=S9QIW0_9RHOB|nr:hypothetical protein Salmuc_05685 [Salipiger mucosus DSM 16094]